ncbi:MAG: hypothetical protein ACRD21_20155, partial [Vicinamibacteria bacterium]
MILLASTLASRLIGLERSLWGDEVLSLLHAEELGRSFNGIAYFGVLHAVMELSRSELWLRMPSVLLGSVAVVPFYFALRETAPPRAAILGGLIYALSPFSVAYSQEIRFYGAYFLAAALSFYCLVAWTRESGLRPRLALLASWFLLLLSHFLASLAILGQALIMVWLRVEKRHHRWILGGLLAACLAGPVFVRLFPGLTYEAYSRMTYAIGGEMDAVYLGPRGYSLAVFAKVPLTFYFFAIGESVHPLWWWISLPAVALVGYLALRGLLQARRNARALWLGAWALLVLPIVLLFLVFDPISPPDAGLASPKYISFALFPLIALVSYGAVTLRPPFRRIAEAGALLVCLIGLAAHYRGDWYANEHKSTDWRAAVGILKQWFEPGTLVVADGRSGLQLDYYLPEWRR